MTSRSSPLVVVFLRGGADGLSLLRPLEDPILDAARPGLTVDAAATVPVGEGFGLHPALARTALRVADGTVALVPACGLPDASRSHFSAQFAVERGDGTGGVQGGWLGRHLAATAGDEVAPFRGVALGQPQVPALLGGSTDVLAAAALADVALEATGPGATGGPDAATLAALWDGDGGPPGGAGPRTTAGPLRRRPVAGAGRGPTPPRSWSRCSAPPSAPRSGC